MSDPIKFIDKMNQAIYGDDWTMEKAQKALEDACGIPDVLLGSGAMPTETSVALQAGFLKPLFPRT